MEPASGSVHGGDRVMTVLEQLSSANEQVWISIGSAAETMNDTSRALSAYDSALLHNPYSVPALSAMASIYRSMDHFDLAVDYFQRVLDIDRENGEVWGAMGHCYLMMDELEKAYTAYHQALCHLPNPREPKLWYGIGILYDRYGSLEHAEETFSSVVRMNPEYEKTNEIYFRLGIIYKRLGQFETSLECFRYILSFPPKPLTEMDIWFQIGHVYEQKQEFDKAKEAYERVLSENTDHAKVLQQLGGLYMHPSCEFADQEKAMDLLHQSLNSDQGDAQTWYLLGRAYMSSKDYSKAYDAYQQAVYRDGKNPVLWCSIGILYFLIGQYHDALGAFSRSIRLHPYIPEVWFNLGILYESCNNQISDAVDAYRRMLELEPENAVVQKRLGLLQSAESSGQSVPQIPAPKDMPFYAYSSVAALAPDSPPPGSMDEESGWAPNYEALDPMQNASAAGDQAPAAPLSGRELEAQRGGAPSMPPSHSVAHNEPREMLAHSGRSYGTPSEWDRQHAGPYNQRTAVYPASHMPLHRHPSYEGAPSGVPSYYSGPPYRDDRGYGGAAPPPKGRTAKPLSPARERADARADMMHHRSHDAAGVMSTKPMGVRLASSDMRTASSDVRTASNGVDREHDAASSAPQSSIRQTAASREVDEDYDEGAASALIGLAGVAASAYEASAWGRQGGDTSSTSAKRPGEADRTVSDAKRPRNGDTRDSNESLDETGISAQ